MRPLSEIVAEGRRLRSAYESACDAERDSEAHAQWDALCAFWDEHGQRLLAAVEAGMVLRNTIAADWPMSLRAEVAAFDSAARLRQEGGR